MSTIEPFRLAASSAVSPWEFEAIQYEPLMRTTATQSIWISPWETLVGLVLKE